MKITKVNEYCFKIEKEGKMKVPVYVYASEKVFKKLQEDKSIEQGVNVATLPGIVKKSIMLPDAHQGYGFSIGGVAAMDSENGCISPGGVGFDINCIHPSVVIKLKQGTFLPIKKLRGLLNSASMKFVDLKNKTEKETNAILFMKKKGNGELYHVKTKTGRLLRVTGDHPVYTSEGMKLAKNLSKEDSVIVSPFKGVEYTKPSDEIILTLEDVEKNLAKLKVANKGNAKTQIINHFKKLNIFPLRYNSPILPAVLKLMGFIFGDGCICTTKRSAHASRLITSFYAKKEDLLSIQNDIRALGIIPSKIYERKRRHNIKTKYGIFDFEFNECHIKQSSTVFALLLIALGTPYGRKTHMAYRIPGWIMKACSWQKRLFLAAFFGAELSKPKTLNRYNFYELQLNMNKSKKLQQNAIDFLNDIRLLLMEFKIQSRYPCKVEGNNYEGKYGPTVGLRLSILSNPKNLIAFFETIGYEYNRKKKKFASYAVSYMRYKEHIQRLRFRLRTVAKSLYRSGIGSKQILATLESRISEYTPQQFVLHSLWSERKVPRIAFNFPSFGEYAKKYAFGNDGLVVEPLLNIEKKRYGGYVYDLTMDNPNHNFIADQFVVSNCGVRVLSTNLTKEEVEPNIKELLEEIFKNVPVGVGRNSKLKLADSELDEVFKKGARWAVEHDLGNEDDLVHCEENGCITDADPNKVSHVAKARGRTQLGTLGAGNHFMEVQFVDQIYEKAIAKKFYIHDKDQISVMIHCGSRGLGHQVCSDYIRKIEDAFPEIRNSLPDKDLIYAPVDSKLSKDYFGAMASAANFAWCNRHIIAHEIRGAFRKIFGEKAELKTIYDIAHNMAKLEEHTIDGVKRKVYVHRKGATRCFPAHHEGVPETYKDVGHPVLIPGSMGTASYICVGTEKSLEETFGSTAHGAGRVMSRHRANELFRGEKVRQELEEQHIYVKSGSWKGLSEEAPLVYKDIDEVIKITEGAGIAKPVVRLKPLGVVKG